MEQWYKENPQLLNVFLEMMRKTYPNFVMGKLEDGRLYWHGSIRTGFNDNDFPNAVSEYYFMVLYESYYPNFDMGVPVRIYPIKPDMKDIYNQLGFMPFPNDIKKDDSDEDGYFFDLCDYPNSRYPTILNIPGSMVYRISTLFFAIELYKRGDLSKEDITKPSPYGNSK